MSARPKTMSTHRVTPAQIRAVPSATVTPQQTLTGHLRVLTCGSVDDGKSTLIGRLLWDASDLFDDQRETLRKTNRRALGGQHIDYSLLVDGLLAEREQGITIDIAWRYFDTAERRFTIIDSPGHAQYTRNMASGATQADVAVMLIDARHGIKSQTRRHAALLDLFGVRQVVLVVNKMDLVDWSEARFREIEADFQTLTQRFRFNDVVAIPVAAVSGDNVARHSGEMPWYQGPTLLERLNTAKPEVLAETRAFRMPIQRVLRDAQDFRGLSGTVASGSIALGDDVVDIVSGVRARVARIATMDGDLPHAGQGRAITLLLDRDVDISRGAVLAHVATTPRQAAKLDARLVWLSETPFDARAQYQLRTATDSVRVSSLTLKGLLDLETLDLKSGDGLGVNDIAEASIALARPVAADPFAALPRTGAFLLVDAVSGATVAGGVVLKTTESASAHTVTAPSTFRLTRADLAADLCADLGSTPRDQAEFARRSAAVVTILRQAGVTIELADLE